MPITIRLALFFALILLLTSTRATCAAGVQTQPPASDLLNDARLQAYMSELSASPRVRVEIIGRSHEGRPVYLIAIGAPNVIERLEEYRGRMIGLTLPAIRHQGATRTEIREQPPEERLNGVPLPVMFVGGSWGHEAAIVEGLLAAAHELAFSDSPEVREILAGTLALIVPLANPDGRARALREWQRTPRSMGHSGAGNAMGLILNRDFAHVQQPESRAVIAATLRWRPVGGIDFQEDVFHLGVELPQTCFITPFEEGNDIEENPRTRQAVTRIGKAVYERWTAAGFRALFDEHGDRHFAPKPEPGKGVNHHGPSDRLDYVWGLHGMAGAMVESARSLGTQSWDDRVRQKPTAVLATLQEVARHRTYYARAVYDRKLEEARAGGSEFIVIPLQDQPDGALRSLLDTLTLHDVEIFGVESPFPALIVPLGQREAQMARHLLTREQVTLGNMPAALGLRVLQSRELSPSQLEAFAAARLMPARVPAAEPVSREAKIFSARPTIASTKLANRMLEVASPVYLAQGRYYFDDSGQRLSREALLLGVNLQSVTPADRPGATGHPLRLPRVAIYTGQGADAVQAAEVVWALREADFPYLLLDESSLERGLTGVQALIVPGGSADEIVHGWKAQAIDQHDPWEPARPLRGLEEPGLARIRAFVQAGGTYVGIGGGGAYLAGTDYLKLVDTEMVPAAVGVAVVRVRPLQSAAAELLSGLPAEPFPAFFEGLPGTESRGLAFRRDATAFLAYDGTITPLSEDSLISDGMFQPRADLAAAVYRPSGRGRIVLFGITPAYRGQWRQTFQLLYDALYL